MQPSCCLLTVAGPCRQECFLEVFPKITDGNACQACGRANKHIWHDPNLAGLDLNVTVNYTRESMLIGTTMTSFARDITTMLQSQDVQVICGLRPSDADADCCAVLHLNLSILMYILL